MISVAMPLAVCFVEKYIVLSRQYCYCVEMFFYCFGLGARSVLNAWTCMYNYCDVQVRESLVQTLVQVEVNSMDALQQSTVALTQVSSISKIQ